MSKSQKISVIMTTYNRSYFLPQAIEGILSQTFDDFEFILVNNGSTDESAEICRKYAEIDHRIKIIEIFENKGASSGKNKGIAAATSEYITIVDDDDYCEPGMLEFLWNLSQKYSADISMCGSWNNIEGELEPYFIFDELLVLDRVEGLNELLLREKYNVAPPTKLFRKILFEGIQFQDNVLVDDIHIIYKVFANADVVVAHGKPLYIFRKHEGNMTSFIQTNKIPPALLSEYLSAFCERTEYLSKKVPDIAPRAKYSELSYMISMCDKLSNSTECVELFNSMKMILRKNYNELMSSLFTTDREKSILRDLLA
ncbi:glycosyltransferase family 2 protein [Paenibacillus crassostreae]|uniref:glycosyltransferase family 2 protein n=1 Tax=Paenibacillus crassostreae TaxID=1763538 RepID=UPI000AC4903F|nr:glycosyltransferase family 2 protein [Paenibacillus crassostreae]